MTKVIIIVTCMTFFALSLVAGAKDANRHSSWDSSKGKVKTQEVRKDQGTAGNPQTPKCPKCQNGDRGRTEW